MKPINSTEDIKEFYPYMITFSIDHPESHNLFSFPDKPNLYYRVIRTLKIGNITPCILPNVHNINIDITRHIANYNLKVRPSTLDEINAIKNAYNNGIAINILPYPINFKRCIENVKQLIDV